MEQSKNFRGVVTELITPFKKDGSVDYELLKGEVEYQIKMILSLSLPMALQARLCHLQPMN